MSISTHASCSCGRNTHPHWPTLWIPLQSGVKIRTACDFHAACSGSQRVLKVKLVSKPLKVKLLSKISRCVFSWHTLGIRRKLSHWVKTCRLWIEVFIFYIRFGLTWNAAWVFTRRVISRPVWKRGFSLCTIRNLSWYLYWDL